MAEKNSGNDDDLNLELPSLSLRRKRKDKGATEAKSEAVEAPAVDENPAAEETVQLPVTEEPARFAPPPSADTAPVTHEPAPAPYVAPETPKAPVPAPVEPARPLYVDESPEAAVADADAPEAVTKQAREPKAAKPPKDPKPKKELTLPLIPGMQASVITGILIGILACGATYVALQGCQRIKGTSACGGPGFLLLIAILIALVVIGGALLKAFRVTDPGSTSFLAVGLLSVFVLLFLVEVIFEWWMIIVIPIVAAVTFALSHWVTVRFIEPAND
jgi:hypothetical protein